MLPSSPAENLSVAMTSLNRNVTVDVDIAGITRTSEMKECKIAPENEIDQCSDQLENPNIDDIRAARLFQVPAGFPSLRSDTFSALESHLPRELDPHILYTKFDISERPVPANGFPKNILLATVPVFQALTIVFEIFNKQQGIHWFTLMFAALSGLSTVFLFAYDRCVSKYIRELEVSHAAHTSIILAFMNKHKYYKMIMERYQKANAKVSQGSHEGATQSHK
eukprot:1005015_1